MDDRSKLTLLRGIKSGAFSDRQKLDAIRAIQSNADDNQVADLIGSLQFATLNTGKDLNQLVDERIGRDRENFDYTSGGDGRLRSLMSFGETEQDREAILSSLVGEDGYVRDPSGQLALTEKGQRERGMEPIGKNLVIEDEGFSMRDVSDFVGILPETVGGTLGAIAGGGLTFGIGSVAGAAGGAAAGQAIEEALEQMLGVQTQSLGEVARDVAIEGALGAGGELVGAAVVAAGRGVMGAGRAAGRSIAGRSPMQEIADDRLIRSKELLDKGYIPSLEAMGAPKPLSYLQKFSENAGKVDKRIKANTETALIEKADFLKSISGDPSERLAEDVMWYAPGQFQKLKAKRNDAQKSIIKAVDESIDLVSKSVDESVDLNQVSLGRITGAFDKFGQQTKDNFGIIDKMLSQIQTPVMMANGRQVMRSGDQLKLFDTQSLQNSLTDYMNEMRNLADPAAQQAEIFLRGTQGNASFTEMANLRKSINDSLYFGGNVSTKARGVLEGLRGQIDTMMDGDTILDDIRINTRQLTPDEKQILKGAADQRNFSIKEFREGMGRFEKLSNLGIIRSVRDLQSFDGYEPKAISDKFFDKVIKDDSPVRLKAVLDAADNPNELQDMFARRYLEDALKVSGRDLINPQSFNGRNFANKIEKLGSTGPQLFGKEWPQVKKIAREIGNTSAKDTISIDDVQRVTEAAGGETSIVANMSNLLDAQNELTAALKTSVIKNINAGDYENYDSAVRTLTNPNLTQDEVIKIMRFFDNQPQMAKNMKNVVLQNILSKVDGDVFSSPTNAGALKKEVSQYKPGALKKILGRETYESLLKFSDNLDALGDVGKEGEIAAGSIWATFLKHPVAALSSIGKVKLIANGLGNPATAKAFLKIQETAGTDPEMQARAILSLINDTMVEEGIDVGGAASKAGKIVQGATQVAGQAGRVNRQVLPRALGAGSAEQSDQTRTSVRPAPTRPVFEIPNVSMPSFPDSDEPIGPIQQLRGNVQKEMLRRRARENPALASILLGGLGNADLL